LPGKTEDNHERTQEAIFAGNETAVDMQPVWSRIADFVRGRS
jgi:hypothetical protein